MGYMPGTLDDSDVLRRRQAQTRRKVREANTPSRTQTYQTTSKIVDTTQLENRLSKAEGNAANALETANTAQQTADNLTDRVDALENTIPTHIYRTIQTTGVAIGTTWANVAALDTTDWTGATITSHADTTVPAEARLVLDNDKPLAGTFTTTPTTTTGSYTIQGIAFADLSEGVDAVRLQVRATETGATGTVDAQMSARLEKGGDAA